MTVIYCTSLQVSNFMALKRDPARVINANANAAQADIDMGSNVVNYSVGDTIIIYDDTSPLGESLVIDSIAGTTLTCTTNLVNAYTVLANAKVENQSHFTPRSRPTKAEVDELIEMNEDILDREIHTSYRNEGEHIEEYVTVMLGRDRSFPYYSQPLSQSWNTDPAIKLTNRTILPFDRSKGDFLFCQMGGEWKDILDHKNGYKFWESVIDTLVDEEDLSAGSPITCTIAMQPRLATKIHWTLTHANITEFDLEIAGTDQAGAVLTETFDETDGWDGYTDDFFHTITSVTFTRVVGLGTGDELTLDTEKSETQDNADYHIAANYDRGIFYPGGISINTGHNTVRVGYRRGFYRQEQSSIPGDIKKACILLTAVDLLLNERYALNLPHGGGTSQIDTLKTVENWKSQYRHLLSKRREIVGGIYYQ